MKWNEIKDQGATGYHRFTWNWLLKQFVCVLCLNVIAVLMSGHVVDAKLQVLANLANFAYDPINYEYLRQLNALDLFLGK